MCLALHCRWQRLGFFLNKVCKSTLMRSKIFFWNFDSHENNKSTLLFYNCYLVIPFITVFSMSPKTEMVIWLKINFPRDTRRSRPVNNLWMQCDVSCREDIINVSNEASPMGIGSTMKRIVEWGKSRFTAAAADMEKKKHVPNIFPRPAAFQIFLVGVCF